MASDAPRSLGLMAVLHRLFASWRFPAFTLSLLLFYKVLLVFMLLVPMTDDALGRFAEEFKTWCFGYDPATGRMEPMYVVMMLTEPLAIGGVLLLVWWGQLKEVMRTPRALVPYAAAAFVLVAVGAGAFGMLAGRDTQGELPFPAERLRTAHTPPSFQLVDHEGRPVSLEEYRGRVVVLTGIYATCGYTCPMLLRQAKGALAALTPQERAEVSVVAITLDPERDNPEAMAKMAKAQGVAAPTFRLASGDAAHVNEVLDTLNVARRRDPQTGAIDHTNLFVVVDRSGRIAYRFSLGERQQQWLTSALRFLLREGRPVG